MSAVMNTIGVAFAYAVLALFAQNAIFTRGLGVSRLIQLVGDERTSSWWFALLLCVTQTLVAPLAYFAGSQIVDLPYRAQLRPLLYLACVAVVCIFEHAILRAVKARSSKRTASTTRSTQNGSVVRNNHGTCIKKHHAFGVVFCFSADNAPTIR